MTIQNLLQQCRKKSHSKVLRFWVVLAAVALLLVLACRGYDWDALGRYKGDNISSLHYVRGRVVEVLRDDTKPDQLDPARSMGTQELRILLLEGANKGTEVTIANYLTRTQNVRLRQGETAIICEDLPDSADAYYTVYNYDRAPVLVLILAVFAAAVVAIGGWKGVRTLLGLGFTGAMIAWLILPGIYHGLPSLPLTVAALAVCTLVSLLLLNPPSPKTWAAMLSTLAGVALAGGVFYLFSTLLHLSGMGGESGMTADVQKNADGSALTEVTNPDGVQYITMNSASGSKFYKITEEAFEYTAVQNQEKVPNYSVANVTKDAFTVTTYRSTDDSVVDTITIKKSKNGWETVDGKDYWYEDGVKQGTEGRGKEIYDPESDAWYWLDSDANGAKAVSKDVYQESDGGKWVRYDENGQMIKGWNTNENGTYYFDLITGAMAHGTVEINGKTCHFDEATGILK